MSSASKLGKGLNALLDSTQEVDTSQTAEVSIELLQPNPWQPRRSFADAHLEELANSIRSQGIIQPLLVRQMPDKTYQVIAGERRLRAAKMVGLTTVPIYIRSMTDGQVMFSTLVENLQRQDLDPIEEAVALKNIRDELGLTQEELAEKIGRSRPSIANSLRLLQLSPAAQDDVRSGKISAGHGRALLGINDAEIAESMRNYVVEKGLSVRETEDLIADWKNTGSLPWGSGETKAPEARRKRSVGTRKKATNVESLAKKMEDMLSQILCCKAKVRGNEVKGKITLTYASAEELQQLLLKIGANTFAIDPNELEKKIAPELA